jgi:hypothetical protein
LDGEDNGNRIAGPGADLSGGGKGEDDWLRLEIEGTTEGAAQPGPTKLEGNNVVVTQRGFGTESRFTLAITREGTIRLRPDDVGATGVERAWIKPGSPRVGLEAKLSEQFELMTHPALPGNGKSRQAGKLFE